MDQVNDEILLYNRSLKSSYQIAISNELMKLRTQKISDLYENLFKTIPKEKQLRFIEKYIWKYEFKSLPSYDFRVKKKFKN